MDIYEQTLKPFFAHGDNHIAFYQKYFNENLKENRMIERREREQLEKVKGDFCRDVVIIDPRSARFYPLWH